MKKTEKKYKSVNADMCFQMIKCTGNPLIPH